MKELFFKYGIGFILGFVFYFILLCICSCSFDYDSTILPANAKIIGEPCDIEGEERKYTQGDLELCVICAESADGLVWFKVTCEEEE